VKRSLLVILVVTGVLAAAIALVINYATQYVPDFFKADPWRVWFVLGLLVLLAIIIALVGARIPVPLAGDNAVPRLGTGNQSLRPPDPLKPVRGRLRLRLWLTFGTAHGLVVLAGAGGMGKSTLANSAACAPQRKVLQRTHWIRLRDEEELARRMQEVAQELGLKPARIAAAQQAGQSLPDLVWRHLDQKLGWMIVLDNIDRADATSPEGDPVAEYRGWIRPPRWGLLLVTSRDREGWGRQARVHTVGPLEPKAAAKVLRDLAPLGGSDEGALRLAQRLGGLPLALQVAARSINAPLTRFRTFDAYADALEALPDSLLPDRPDVEDPQVHRLLIGYTWELSLNQLASESLRLARPLMRLLALCADAPIPQQFVATSLLQDLVGGEVSQAAVTGALSGLCRFGLVEEGFVVDGVCAIEIHPVVRESMAALLEGRDGSPTLASGGRCGLDCVDPDVHR
jgi:NB-ARC domain